MIDTSPNYLLMIEPSANVSTEPVIDALTLRMASAFLKARSAHAAGGPRGLFPSTQGGHTAASGAMSDNICWHVKLPGGVQLKTNSLAVHYAAWSRHEIPQSELDKLERLPISQISFAAAESPEVIALINPRGFTPPSAHAQVSRETLPGSSPVRDESLAPAMNASAVISRGACRACLEFRDVYRGSLLPHYGPRGSAYAARCVGSGHPPLKLLRE